MKESDKKRSIHLRMSFFYGLGNSRCGSIALAAFDDVLATDADACAGTERRMFVLVHIGLQIKRITIHERRSAFGSLTYVARCKRMVSFQSDIM